MYQQNDNNMKANIFKTALVFGTFFTLVSCNSSSNEKIENMETKSVSNNPSKDPSGIFDKGHLGSEEYFTGTSYVTPILVRKGIDNTANVAFEAGSRTFWHTHQIGQVLIVTEGEGFYQERGKKAHRITKGDVVNIPADVEHWHGATATTGMTHIAITNFDGDELVTWLGPVTDEEFKQVNQ